MVQPLEQMTLISRDPVRLKYSPEIVGRPSSRSTSHEARSHFSTKTARRVETCVLRWDTRSGTAVLI